MTYPVVRVGDGLYNAIADGHHGVVIGYDGANKSVCDDILQQLGFSQSDVVPPIASGIIDAVFTRVVAPDAGAQRVYIFIVSPPYKNFPRLNEMQGDWGLFIVSDAYVSREFIYSIYVSMVTQCDIDEDDYIIRCGHSGF